MLAVLKEKKRKKKKRKPGHGRKEPGASAGTKDWDSGPGEDVYVRVPYTLTPYASLGRRWSRRGSVLGRSRNGETFSEA